MRRSTLATLANLARAASLGVSLVAAGTAALWAWAPETIRRGEGWLHDRFTASTVTRWATAQAEPDPRRQAQQCEDLLLDLETVRPGHRFAPIVAGIHGRLTDLALTRGDRAGAVAWLREAVAFDSDAVAAKLELGDLLGQQPDQPDRLREGLELLQSLVQRPSGDEALLVPTFPGQTRVTATLAGHLLRNGRGREALDVLDRARREPPPSLWAVKVRGTNGTESTAEFVPERTGDDLHFTFCLREATAGLHLALPPGASAELITPRLTITTAGETRTVDLLDGSLQDLVRHGDRLHANGDGKPAFAVQASIAAGASVHVQTGWRERPPERLLAVARMPQFAELGTGLTTAADTTRLASLRAWLQLGEVPR